MRGENVSTQQGDNMETGTVKYKKCPHSPHVAITPTEHERRCVFINSKWWWIESITTTKDK